MFWVWLPALRFFLYSCWLESLLDKGLMHDLQQQDKSISRLGKIKCMATVALITTKAFTISLHMCTTACPTVAPYAAGMICLRCEISVGGSYLSGN
jgi:hypothetical protein